MTVLASHVIRCERDVADAHRAVLRWRRLRWMPFAGIYLSAALARHTQAKRALSRAQFAVSPPAPKGTKFNSKGYHPARTP